MENPRKRKFEGEEEDVEPLNWELKHEKDRREGKRRATEDPERRAQEEELMKMKQQREERAKERLSVMERSEVPKLSEPEASFHLKEDEFILQQAKIRAHKRVSEGRGTPLDFLFCVVHFPDPFTATTVVPPPSKVMRSLPLQDIKPLASEVENFKRVDPECKEYWTAVALFLVNTFKKAKGQVEDDGSIHPAVIGDIQALFEDLSEEKLAELESLIKRSLRNGEMIDEEFWHSLLKRLTFFYAKAKVDGAHSEMVKKRTKYLHELGLPEHQIKEIRTKFFTFEVAKKEAPKKVEEEPEVDGITFSAKIKKLTAEDMIQMEVEKGEGHGERRIFNEIELDTIQREGLKKPAYYNRVLMGIDWNKHNLAHYTEDNPPPETVQGYQFRIFFPDLDPHKTPDYQILPTENPDLVLLLFKAAPPYHDIAFKIVNGEWEKSQKKGFRSHFSNGILTLRFWYRKYRYKR